MEMNVTKDIYKEGTVYYNKADKTFSYKLGVIDKEGGVAYGYYNNTLNQTGWSVMEITAGCKGRALVCDDNVAMYGAGLLEGIFSAEQMGQHYENIRPFFLSTTDKKLEDLFRAFFTKQDAWMRAMILQSSGSDPLWAHAGYVLAQFDGLYAGYKLAGGNEVDKDIFVVQFLNAVGDLIDLKGALHPQGHPDVYSMSGEDFRQYVLSAGHCSALVKITGGYENLYMSHSSWFLYASMMRIYKHYHFQLNDPNTAAHSVSFSSYPGFLVSLDDFYLMDSKLVMIQTTNQIFNTSLYKLISPESLFAWHRVRLANFLSHTGQDWHKHFKRYNSGTYNNQYMVIDLKKVHLKEKLDNDALWVVEQIPGLVEGADQTDILRTGYWPSYNVPFYESIYNLSGYPAIVDMHGPDYSYQLAPRAKIFRRDAGLVKDFPSMKDMLRYNDYKHDDYSEGQPCNTICCRGDLESDWNDNLVLGCYDTKVSDYSLALNLKSLAINGPTTSHSLPVFSWVGQFSNQSHIGLPRDYNFDWQPMAPRW